MARNDKTEQQHKGKTSVSSLCLSLVNQVYAGRNTTLSTSRFGAYIKILILNVLIPTYFFHVFCLLNALRNSCSRTVVKFIEFLTSMFNFESSPFCDANTISHLCGDEALHL
jgi:hypothetical protein